MQRCVSPSESNNTSRPMRPRCDKDFRQAFVELALLAIESLVFMISMVSGSCYSKLISGNLLSS